MTALKRNECKRQCRYNYTSAERLEKGRALADEYNALGEVQADFDRIKKDYKAREETHETKIQSLAEQVRSGYELRETLCHFTYNEPKPGRKTLRRSDTMEIIGEEDMTGADTQAVMEEIDAEASGEPTMKNVTPFPALPSSEKRKARRASSNGVVGTEADGEDLTNPDDRKGS